MASVTTARVAERIKEIAEWREPCRAWAKSDFEVGVTCSGATVMTQAVTVTATAEKSVTNTQHAGVDEGGIVKRRGDVLVVLRRGRLFTIGIGREQLEVLDVADAFGPGQTDEEIARAWYDELLVWENCVIVIGYSYARGGTEIGLFDLGARGQLQHRATYHLRSDDYYSGSGYASRLVGDRLLLFLSFTLPENADPNVWLPSLRRWTGRPSDSFVQIAPLDRVFQSVAPLGLHPAVHTLVSCQLSAPDLTCEATVVLGDTLNVYYASPTAAYAWTTAWNGETATRSLLYRIPFDGAPVAAIRVTGTPRDQLSFFEDAQDNLNVVVAHPDDVVTLLRLPISSFSDGSAHAPDWHYRPIARGLGPWFSARFVGRYALVGAQAWPPEEEPHKRRVVVAPYASETTYSLSLTHDVERIEAVGAHAVVVGSGERTLSLTAIRLADQPRLAGTLLQHDAFQSEHRSHAFFYREDTAETGLFGLPIVTRDPDVESGVRENSAQVLFVRNSDLTFASAGTLDATPGPTTDDGCLVSCTDWYGNARPVFIEDRIFALLGYEIVEGRLGAGGVQHIRRLGFMPRAAGR